jgi:hypothetical protein
MKKLITIPEHLVEPLLVKAAKEHKGNLHSLILDVLAKSVETDNAIPFFK